MNKAALLVSAALLFAFPALKAADGTGTDIRSSAPQGEYLGQKPPGMTPEIFAPGILGAGISKRDVAISSDGGEIYFGASSGRKTTIYWLRLRDGRWSEPEVAPFASDSNYHHFEPCLSADGLKIYFLTNRPAIGKEPKPGWAYQNIWAANREADGSWGEPYDLGPVINGDTQQYFPSLTGDGTLYFTRVDSQTKRTAIWRARPVAGKYPVAERLPDKINGNGTPYNAFIASDESFLIACVDGRPVDGNPGKANYFAFFRDPNDAWSDVVPFGSEINLPGSAAMSPYVSPDGKYFFFAAKSDIFWVEAKVIAALKEKKSVIPLKSVGPRSFITVKVGDRVVPDILLDTGFAGDGLLIYNPDLRAALDLSRAQEAAIGGAGGGDAQRALVLEGAELGVGPVQMKDQRIIVLLGDIFKGFPSNGVIGHSIFGHHITEIDHDSDTMTLHEALPAAVRSGWTGVPLYFKGNAIPWIDASVAIADESPLSLSMYIDYAAGDSVVLLERPQMKFRLPASTKEFVLGRGLQGDIHGKQGVIAALALGPHVLRNVLASFAAAEIRSKQDNADAVIGSGALKRFNLIFDYAGKMLYIKPNSHFHDPYQ